MKVFICTAVLISAFLYARSQGTNLKIDNFKNPDPTTIIIPDVYAISLGENGLVVNETKDKLSSIRYYNSNGREVWRVNADKEYSTKNPYDDAIPGHITDDMSTNFMVASNDGSWIYNVEMKPDAVHKKPQFITQIDKSGNTKKFTIEGREDFGKSLQTVFCDSKYFYYLTTGNGDEEVPKKMGEEQLILNRFDAKDFSYKKIVLKLPSLTRDAIFWTYLGQTNNEKFLVSSEYNENKQSVVITVVAFNGEGEVTRTLKLEPQLTGKFVRKSVPVASPVSNFHKKAELYYDAHSPKGSYYFITDAFSIMHTVFDSETQSFFVYGLSGPKPLRTIGSVYDGFFLFKYDLNGEIEWKLEQPASAQMKADNFFRVHGSPGFRRLFLRPLPDRSFYFSIQCKKSLYVFHVTANGGVRCANNKGNQRSE